MAKHPAEAFVEKATGRARRGQRRGRMATCCARHKEEGNRGKQCSLWGRRELVHYLHEWCVLSHSHLVGVFCCDDFHLRAFLRSPVQGLESEELRSRPESANRHLQGPVGMVPSTLSSPGHSQQRQPDTHQENSPA
jgi:hypothetical protein